MFLPAHFFLKREAWQMTTTEVSETLERVDHWRKIKKARQRLVLCRLMIDMMRTVHGAYAPASEPFGARLETFFIALCVALGDIDGKLEIIGMRLLGNPIFKLPGEAAAHYPVRRATWNATTPRR
jgi:hypothetical protein